MLIYFCYMLRYVMMMQRAFYAQMARMRLCLFSPRARHNTRYARYA